MEEYGEIRIEVQASELSALLQEHRKIDPEEFRHNNTFVCGKDIGLNGWIIFIFRVQKESILRLEKNEKER